MPILLEIDGLVAGYGRIDVLHGVSLQLEERALCALVGANGAGKTTLLRALSRLIPIRAGRIVLDGVDVTHASAHARVRAGLVHVPEGRHVLATMTVSENLSIAGAVRPDRAAVAADVAALYERFPILGTRRQVLAGSLSGGEQQMLAIARALLARPKVLLLDEPSMGLSPKLVGQIFDIIAAERARGTTIFLVEQNARRALEIADRAYVLERGRIVLSGKASELIERDEIVAAYLGAGAATGPASP